MDIISCKICAVPYDEDKHRPRNPACGHELCSLCIRAIIRNSVLECPKCREKSKVYDPEDLQTNFALIDIIRAFKAQQIAIPKQSKPNGSGATNDEICKVHMKSITHRCIVCILWICIECLESHSSALGCTTINSVDAIRSIKERHSKEIKDLLTTFKDESKDISSDIQGHLDLAKKHGEEAEKLKKLNEEGNIHEEKLIESENHLKAADSPYRVTERSDIVIQRKQLLRSWFTKRNGSDSALKIKEGTLAMKTDSADSSTFDTGKLKLKVMQKQVLPNPTVVFIELSLGSKVKGRLEIQLNNDLPNIKEYMINIVTNKYGKSLFGVKPYVHCADFLFASLLSEFKDMPAIILDSKGTTNAKRGDVAGFFVGGYLDQLCFTVSAHKYNSSIVLGTIVKGLDILDECVTNHKCGVRIEACGLA